MRPQPGQLGARHAGRPSPMPAAARVIGGRCPQLGEGRRVPTPRAAAASADRSRPGRAGCRAHVLADVAAVDVRAERGPQRLRDFGARSSMVRYDRHRVESSTPGSTRAPVGHASRHRVQVPHCSRPWRVGLERQAGDHDAQEQPRAQLGIDEAGVLADPPEPGVLRVHAFLHRAGVHVGQRVERLARTPGASTPPARRAAASGRRGSRRPRRSGRCGRRPRAGRSEYGRSVLYSVPVTMTLCACGITARTSRRRSAVRAIQAISPGVAAVQPLAQERELGEVVHRRHAAQVEAQRLGLRLHRLG